MAEFQYIGNELETFALATNWKAYLRDAIGPFIGGDVLEVGAGIGATMRALRTGAETSWTCLEPDPAMARTLTAESAAPSATTHVVAGTLADLAPSSLFDTILYVDVLEHIEDDEGEVRRAAALLRPGGRLVVMSPAHQQLYSPFDAHIGHFRRYNKKMLGALTPPDLDLRRLVYLDATGFLLSAANRVLLRSRMPTRSQVLTWDRYFIPISRRLDRVLRGTFGKSVLAVWERRGSQQAGQRAMSMPDAKYAKC